MNILNNRLSLFKSYQMKKLVLFVVLVCLSAVAMSQPYYSKAAGDLDLLATWGDQPDGSGASPGDFTTAGVTYIVTNRATATLGAAWAVSGVGSKVQVGDGVTTVDFTVPATFAFTGVVDVTSTGTLTLNNATIPTFGTLDAASTVVFSAGAVQSIPGGTYGNLTVSTTTFAKTFAGAVTVAGNLTASSTSTGSITMFAGTNNVTGNLAFTTTSTGDFLTSGALNIGGDLNVTSANTGGTFTLGGNMDVNGNVTLAATANASSWFVPNGFQINVAGNWTVTSTSNTPSTFLNTTLASTVVFDGTGAQTISKTAGAALTANFYHFQNSNTGGTVTVATTPSLTTTNLAGNFTNDLGATFACAGANQVNVTGNWTNNGTFTRGTSTVSIINTVGTVTLSGNMTGTSAFYNLTTLGAGTRDFGANSADVVNSLTQSGGNITAPSTTLSIGLNYTHTLGTFTHNGGTVVMNGTVAQALSTTLSTTFNNLTISNTTAAVTPGSNITVDGTLTVDNGANLNMSTRSLTAGGSFAVTNNGTIQTQFATTVGLPTGKTWGGLVSYNGTTAAQIVADGTYNNLLVSTTTGARTFNGAVTVTGTMSLTATGAAASPITLFNTGNSFNDVVVTLTSTGDVNTNGAQTINGDLTVSSTTTGGSFILGGNLDVNGNVTLSSATVNSFYDPAGFQTNVAGNWTVSSSSTATGFYNTSSPSLVVFDGTGPQTISKSAGASIAANFYHFQNSNTAGTVTVAISPSVTTTTFAGDFTNDASATFATAGANTINVGGNWTNSASGTFVCGGATTINATGNWTNNGTFTRGASTVIFNAAATGKTITGNLTGASAFNHIQFSNVAGGWDFGANAADVVGNFSVTATAGAGVKAPSTTLKVGGNFVKAAGGTFDANGGTVEFNGTSGQSFPGSAATFNHVTVSNTSANLTANAATTINGNLTTSASSNVNMVTFQLLGTVNGTAHSGTLQTQCTVNPAIPNGATWGGQVTYNSTTTAMFVANGTYNNLTITGTSGARTTTGAITVNGNMAVGTAATTTGITTLGGNLIVAGNLSIGSSTTASIFDVSATNYQITLGGNWSQSSTAATNPFNRRSGLVIINGTGTQTISTTGGTSVPTFYNFQNSNTAQPFTFGSNVVIGNDFTNDAGATAQVGTNTVTITGNMSNAGTLTCGTGILNVGGNWSSTGTFTSGTGTVNMNATGVGRTLSGSMTGANKFYNLTFASATGAWSFGADAADVQNNFTITSSAAGGVTAPSTTLKVGGNFVHTAGTFVHNSGTVELNGTGAQAIPTTATTFNVLTLNNTGGTVSLNAATTVLGDLTIPVGNVLSCGSTTLNLGGNYTNNGTFTAGTSTTVFNGTGALALSGDMTGANKFNILTFNNAGGTWSFGANSADVASAFTITTGTVNAPSTTLKVAGNFVHTAGTFNDNGGTVELNGTVAQAIPTIATTFNHLTISNTAATVTANAAMTVNGTLTTSASANLNMSTFQLLGTLTPAHSGTLQTQCVSNPPIPVAKTWGGLVSYSGGNMNISQGNYNNLTISGTTGSRTFTAGTTSVAGSFSLATTTGVTTLAGDLDVNGSVTIAETGNTNSIFNPAGFNINVGGDWTVSSTGTSTALMNVVSTSLVTFDGTGTQTISRTSGSALVPNFYNFRNSNTSSNPLDIVYSMTISGDVTNDASAILTIGTNTVTVGGNWTNNGTFTANASTVNFNSGVAGKTLTGNMTGADKFNNLTFNGAGTWTFGANSADVAGNFRITTGTVTAPSTTLKVGGDFIHTAGTFTHNSGTVELNGTGAQAIPTSATTFNILNLNNTGGTISLNAATTVNQDFTIPVGNTLSGGSATLTLAGNYTNNGTFTAGTGTVAFTAADAGNTLSGDMTGANQFNNITFNNAAGSWTFGSNSADVGAAFTITTGTVTAPSTTLKVAGNFAKAAAGVFTHNSGTVELDGTGAQTVPTSATTFNTLALNNTGGTITLNSATSVLQDFTIPVSNILACGAQTLNLAGSYSNNGTFTGGTGTVVFNATATGKTLSGDMTGTNKFNNVNFNSASGGWDCGASPIDVGGVFSVTTTAGAGVKAPSTTLKVAGNFVKGAGGTFDANGGTVEFNGTAAQTFPGAATTFNNFTVANITNTVTATAATTINGTLTTAAASYVNMVSFQLLGTPTAAAHSGTLATANATNPAIPTGRTWGGLVLYNGGNQTVAQGNYNNLSLVGTTGTRGFTAGATAVAGTFSVSTTSGIISLAVGGTGALDVNGDFVLAQTGTNTNSIFNPNGNTINVGGNWTVTTSSATTTNLFNAAAASTVILDGTGVQTVSRTAGAALSPNFYGLQVSNTSNPVAFDNSTNIANNLVVAASATVSPTTETVQFNPSAAAGTISGSGTILVNRTTATADYSTQYRFSTNTLGSLTVNYNGAGAQNVNSFTYGTLRTSSSGTKTPQGNVTVNDALDVNSGTTLDMGSANRLIAGTAPTYTVNGTLLTSVPTATSSSPIPSGATWNGSGTVEYGTLAGAQTVVSGTYNNLALDNTSGVNVAGGDINVGGTVTLGKLSLGTANLILADGATVSGASGTNYVVTGSTGNVRKVFSANGTFSFPVGDATNYTPVSINMSGSGYSSAYTQARVTNSKHPSNASATDYLNRYWTVGTSGITAQSYTATATYVGGDISGTEGNIDAATYAGSLPWTMFDPIGSNTLTAPGVSATSVAISGVSNVPPSVSVSPASATICNGGTEPLTATPTGDAPFTYSWSPSTGLSATTGASVNASPVNTGTATATVVYTVTMTDGNGFTATNTTTINVNPQEPISGTLSVCEGSNVTLTPTTPGGNWTSATPAVGTINATSGLFQGIDQGTTAVTYTLPSACFSTVTMTVNNMPAAIGGTLTVCKNATTGLTNSEAGGTWSTSNAAIATVGSSSGVVTGTDAGTATITYTLPGNCFVTAEVTVNALPVLTGITTICNGTSNTLSATPIGGAWTSSDVVVATVGGGTGVVNGLTAGTADISYTDLNSCVKSVQVTVTPTLADISGAVGVCTGLTTTLTHPTPGGTWSSSNTGRVTIDVNTGFVTTISEGMVTITYTLGTGCVKTALFTAWHQPIPITGNLTLCESSYSVLSSTVGGSGTWSSSNVGVATANINTGMITSVSSGTSTITYKIPYTGCQVTAEVTVNPLPGAITGGSTFCQGAVENYTSTTPGGTWLSSNTGVATINSGTGAATGVSAGVTKLSYTLPTGCRVTKTVTVNNMPAAITGARGICVSGTSALASSTPGGVWSSSTPAVGTISVGGVVSAIGIGNTTISYTIGTGCRRTAEVTVNTAPGANTGTAQVCIGSTTTLANATAGGTWASSDNLTATVVAATGVVTGVSIGTANITYALAGGGCYTVTEVTVDAAPAGISGTTDACVGLTSALSHSSPGGVWSSTNPAVASINASSGVVTAVSAGFVTITYMATPTCGTTTAFTSKALPAAITGNLIACVGTSSPLASITTGGSWTSSNTGVAIINATSGVMSGVSVGNATITYTSGIGCQVTAQATINAAPAAITGPASVCFDATTTVNCTPGGGTWTSSNTAAATINSTTGEVTGVAPGTTILTYTHAVSGCLSTRVQTIGATPASITGNLTICASSSSTLANATAGGTWSSSNLAVGTVASATGVVRGISAGTTTITYLHSGGCFVTTEATVNTSISSNSGDNNLCVSGATTLANVTGGGTWSSSTVAKATVGSLTGVVTGVASGTSVITYKLTPSCYATSVVTVAAAPAAISGPLYVCIDANGSFTHVTGGGTWSSSNPAIGSIDASTGVFRGITAGAVTVTYVPSNGCFVTKAVNVSNNPPAISGTMSICEAGASALTCVVGGSATWSSSNTAVGTIGLTSGMLTGLTSGTTTITYRLNTTGCYSVREATVNPLPAAISGSNTICVGSSATYTNATGGGTWSTSNAAIANIGAGTGIAAAGTAGVTTVSYNLTTGCRATKVITVNTLPASITGTTNFCVGGVGVLASSTAGGVWTSDNVAASVAGTGTVTATGTGASVISYTLATGCARTATVNVAAALAANTGNDVICVGGTTTLANVTSGGTWVSSVTAKATVGISTGVVAGVAAGTSNITYKASGVGCTAITQVTVNAALAAITGTTNVCVADVTTLAHAVSGGTWSSSNTGLATVDNVTGDVTGVAAGAPTITYTASPGCFKTTAVTVKALPSAISGTPSVCVGLSTPLSATPTGGTWTSSNSGVALMNLTTGAMVGVAAGNATITYKGTNLCIRTTAGTVNALPANIAGTLTASVTGTSTLTNATPGGAWTSSNITKATVDNTTGVVTGVAVGTSVITYTLPTGCYKTATFSVTASKPGGYVYFTNNDNKVIFSVFPNPTKGAFTIEAPAAGIFSVFTVDGKLVSEYKVNSQTTNVNLPSDLAYGVYMCRFDQEDGESTIVRLWYQP